MGVRSVHGLWLRLFDVLYAYNYTGPALGRLAEPAKPAATYVSMRTHAVAHVLGTHALCLVSAGMATRKRPITRQYARGTTSGSSPTPCTPPHSPQSVATQTPSKRKTVAGPASSREEGNNNLCV